MRTTPNVTVIVDRPIEHLWLDQEAMDQLCAAFKRWVDAGKPDYIPPKEQKEDNYHAQTDHHAGTP